MCIHRALEKILKKDNYKVFNEIINNKNIQIGDCKCNHTSFNSFVIAKMIKIESINILENVFNESKNNMIAEFNEDNLIDLLNVAIKNNRKKFAETLVKKIANINKIDNNGWTPLYCAVYYSNKEMVELLLANGADINKADNNIWTPLYCAVNNNNKEIAELLLANGADINKANNYGWTPLYCAVYYSNKEMVELLLAKGADINKVTNNGWTPLYCAVWHKNKEIVKLLIANGADVNKADNDGKTPLDIAKNKGYKELKALITRKISKNPKVFTVNRKTLNKNKQLILLAYLHDNKSLFADDYLCRDLLKLIMMEIDDQYLLEKFYKLCGGCPN